MKEAMPPKGCMTVRVGLEGEQQHKFMVPVEHLNHPLFMRLLDGAEETYGFDQKGVIALPCCVDDFRHVEDAIECEMCAQRSAHQHHHHLHLARCFRA